MDSQLVDVVAAHDEDDEKQQEEEDQNNPEVLLEVDDQHVENPEQNEDDLSDLEDIFEPKRKKDNEGDQDVHLDNLAKFLDGFDDDELENFL